jgi:flagellar biosynthesis/type III secretory pathway chaperone
MTAGLDDLSVALAAEARHLGSLLALLEEEAEVLARADAASLAAIADRKAGWIRDRAPLEGARRQAVSRIADALGLDPSTVTLTDLAHREPTHAGRLLARRDELRRLAGRLSALVRHNGFLLERSLQHLRGFLSSLIGAVAHPATYTASGRSELPPAALGLVDHRA